MDKPLKRSTVLSFVLHILLLWYILSLHEIPTLVPSRSNGMEVSLIDPEEINLNNVKPQNITPIQYHVIEAPADINLKKQAKPTVATPDKKVPKVVKTHKEIKPVKLRNIKRNTTHHELNDMLDTLTTSKNAGHSHGTALGGSNNGSSNSNNLNSNYADLVIAKVRPFVIIPDGVDASNVAIIEVTLLPNMNVFQVKLLKSSGNSIYDNNLEEAIDRVSVFPPLPDGAKFTDYRKLRLTFRPE